MILKNKEVIDRPLEEVYTLVRDNLPKIVPYLPNVEKIQVKSKKTKNNQTHITNHWFAKAEMPSLIKNILKPEFFAWKDKAVWDNDEYKVEYDLESFYLNDLFTAKGVNTFKAKGENKTEFSIVCEIELYPEKVPGIPKFLAKKITPVINSLLEKIIGPNLSSLGKGIKKYYEEN
jgi:hypothetical protein